MSLREELLIPSGVPYRFRDPVVFDGGATFPIIPAYTPATANPAATTPTVLNSTTLKLTSTSAVSVSNFLYGTNRQSLVVLGDGNSTITNGTNIFTNTGADKLMASNRTYIFHLFDNKWYES